MQKILTLVFFCLIATFTQAQHEETLLSDMRLTGVWASWNSMIGQVKDENVYFRGGSLGFEFGKDLFLGWGGYKSSGYIHQDDLRFYMKWNGPMVSYSPKSYKAVHPVFNLMIANGRIDPDNQSSDRVFIAQPSLGAELNLLTWCHVSVHGGYRFVNDVDLAKYNDADFSGLYGEMKLKLGISWSRW
ncbi:MAG: hypothetical protein ABIR66_09740 [Saprospiraceae bacterium]